MQTAKQGDTVLVDYTVQTSDGRVVGGTDENGPHELKVGGGEIFPEIEAALDGMAVGSEQSVTVTAENAFGPRREDMVIQIPRDRLPAGQAPEPGMTLAAQQQNGETVNLTIIAVDDSNVTADGNHPLAGQDLHFGLSLREIKPAA